MARRREHRILGRSDEQVKIVAFALESPGEIERSVEYPGVREAAVVARGIEPGEKRLLERVADLSQMKVRQHSEHPNERG